MNGGAVDPYTGQLLMLPYGGGADGCAPPMADDYAEYFADQLPEHMLDHYDGELAAGLCPCGAVDAVDGDDAVAQRSEDAAICCGGNDDDLLPVPMATLELPLAEDAAAAEAAEAAAAAGSSPEQSQSGDEPISTDESHGGTTSKGDEGDGEEVRAHI